MRHLSVRACRHFGSKEPSLLDMAVVLDAHRSTSSPLPPQMRKKIGDKIEKEERVVGDFGQLDGMQEAEAEDISELLNEALESKTLQDLIPWSLNAPANFLYFRKVKLNKDTSHVTALWASDLLDHFIELLEEPADDSDEGDSILFDIRTDNTRQGKATRDREYATEKLVTYVSKRLAQREPQFRAVLARKHPMRRVPRIFFAAYDASLGHRDRARAAYQDDFDEMVAAGIDPDSAVLPEAVGAKGWRKR